MSDIKLPKREQPSLDTIRAIVEASFVRGG